MFEMAGHGFIKGCSSFKTYSNLIKYVRKTKNIISFIVAEKTKEIKISALDIKKSHGSVIVLTKK